MKKILFILLLTPFVLQAQIGRFAFDVPQIAAGGGSWTNLVSWWKMTETSGGIAYDSHGSDDGTVVDAVQSAIGVVFDGDDSVSVSPSSFGNDDFTIIMIVNGTYEAGKSRRLITGPTNAFQLRMYEGRSLSAVITGGSSSSSTTIQATAGSVNMIAVVRSGSTFRFFINGAFENETLAANFSAGSNAICGPNGFSAAGQIGTHRDLCIFSDAKSDAYLTAFYNSGSYTDYEDGDPGTSPTWTNLVSWWKMTETSGGTATDSHGSDDATVTGGTQTSSGVEFDGDGDYLTTSTPAFGTDDFTIIMRINPDSYYDGYRSIIGGPTNAFWWALYQNDRPRALIVGGSGSSVAAISLTYGNVSMLAVVRSGNNFRFFIDGSFETETFTTDFTAGITDIGKIHGTYLAFYGIIRDVCIFDDAKADSYITAFYNSGSYTDYEDGDPE